MRIYLVAKIESSVAARLFWSFRPESNEEVKEQPPRRVVRLSEDFGKCGIDIDVMDQITSTALLHVVPATSSNCQLPDIGAGSESQGSNVPRRSGNIGRAR